jgi:hypothetical protein
MITKIRQILANTWPFWVTSLVTFLIMWVILDIDQKHSEYKWRVEYTHGRHAVTYYVDSIVATESSVSFVNEDGDLVEVKGAYLIIKQH